MRNNGKKQRNRVKNQIRSQQDVAVTDEVRGGAKPKRSSVPQPHVSRQQDATQKFPGTQSRQSKKIDNKRCSYCNKYHARGHCAAFGKLCRKCGHYNHFAVCCKTKKVHELYANDASSYLGTKLTVYQMNLGQ
jgi:hypothetical protein